MKEWSAPFISVTTIQSPPISPTIPVCVVHPRWSVHISALASYSPPAAPAWLHPPPLPPPASGIPPSGRWSSWSPAADAVSCWRCCCCCCCCISLWEDRNRQSTSAGQLRSSGHSTPSPESWRPRAQTTHTYICHRTMPQNKSIHIITEGPMGCCLVSEGEINGSE